MEIEESSIKNGTRSFNKQTGSSLGEEDVKLAEAKKERQKMEQAALILENRVLYLEKMNERMNKKLESVKERASEIMKLKKQTKEDEELKKSFVDRKDADLKDKQQKIHEMRAKNEERLNSSKMNSISQSILVAKNTKESLAVGSPGTEGEVPTAEGGDAEEPFGQRPGHPGAT